MKVLLLGSRGQLGSSLKDEFHSGEIDVKYISRNNLDICEYELLKEICIGFKPDVIINSAAYTNVDKAEDNEQDAFDVNTNAVRFIASICKDINCLLVHISTDYVFDGKANRSYLENDKTNPLNVYGMSKLRGEHAIQKSKCKYIIIRTSWVFSEFGNNFLKTIIRIAKENESLNIINDQVGCPTYARDLAKAIIYILPQLLQNNKEGIFNYAGNSSCSWESFAREIVNQCIEKDILDKITNIHGIKSAKFSSTAVRPLNSRLDSSKFESTFGYNASDWKKGITTAISKLENL